MKPTAASSHVRRTIADSEPTKNACHEKPIFTRTMSPLGDLYNLYLLIDLLSLGATSLRSLDRTATRARSAERRGHGRYKVCFGRFASLLEGPIVSIASPR